MEIDRKELKRQARESIRLTSPSFWVVALVFFLLTRGLTFVVGELIPRLTGDSVFVTVFLSVLITFYSFIIQFGLHLWSLWTARKMNPGLDALTQGFSVVGRVLILEFNILGYTVLWSMVIGIGLGLASLPLFLLLPVEFSPFVVILLVAAIYITVWVVTLRYALAPYLLADRPDDGPGAAVRRSAVLMKGWKLELFKLELSFLGWLILEYLLSFLALGVVLVATGCVSALLEVGLDALPDLFLGYQLWNSGFALDALGLSQAEMDLIVRFAQLFSDSLVSLLCSVAMLPVFLFLTPYRSVTLAAFYDARLRLHMTGKAE